MLLGSLEYEIKLIGQDAASPSRKMTMMSGRFGMFNKQEATKARCKMTGTCLPAALPILRSIAMLRKHTYQYCQDIWDP